MSKYKKQIRALVRLMYRWNAPVIYAENIALSLHSPVEMVEAELYQMIEEEKLWHTYELHCCQCGQVIASSEDPRFLTGGPAECPGCWNQSMTNDVVSAFVLDNHE